MKSKRDGRLPSSQSSVDTPARVSQHESVGQCAHGDNRPSPTKERHEKSDPWVGVGDTFVFGDYDNIEAGFQLRARDGGRVLSIPAILSVIGRSKKIVGGHFVLSSVGEPPAHIVSSRPVLKEYDIEMHVMDRIRDSNGDYHAYGTIDCLQEHFLEEIGNSICASAQNSEQPYPTLTLLTGHGEGGYFNTEGFFGAVCLAIKSGIDVNLWAWSEKLSRNFGELEKRGGRDGYGEFHIIYWDAFEKEISVKLK